MMRLSVGKFLACAAPLVLASCTIHSGFGFGRSAPEAAPAVMDEAPPEAAAPAAPPPGLWRARGNEPGWMLTLDGETMRFDWNYGEESWSGPEPSPVRIEDGTQWASEDGGLVVEAYARICSDDMTGMPYPAIVTVTKDGQTFRGCGGEPETLLTGEEWRVETVGAAGVVEGSRVTLAFDGNADRAGGRGGCNSWSASYTLTGEGLSFGPAMSTQMACSDELMQQERAFFDALQAVTGFALAEDGALELISSEGRPIIARR